MLGGGLVSGVVIAVALARLASVSVYGLAPIDASTVVIVTAVVLTTGTVACYLPARRAVRLGTVAALKAD